MQEHDRQPPIHVELSQELRRADQRTKEMATTLAETMAREDLECAWDISPETADNCGALLAYEFQDPFRVRTFRIKTLRVKTLRELYPREFPSQLARAHLSELHSLLERRLKNPKRYSRDHPGRNLQQDTERLFREESLMLALTAAELHTEHSEDAEFIIKDVWKLTGDPAAVFEAVAALTDGDPEASQALIEFHAPDPELPDDTTVQRVMEAARAEGVREPVLRQMARAMGKETHEAGIPNRTPEWNEVWPLLDSVETMTNRREPVDAIASILGINIADPQFIAWQRDYMPQIFDDGEDG